MEEKTVKPAPESTETRSPEQKDYHSPELTVYGNIRELTLANVPIAGRDTALFSTQPT